MPLEDADKAFIAKAIADALKANNDAQATEIGKAIDTKLKPVTDKVGEVEKTAKEAAEKAGKEPDNKGGKEPDNKGGKGGKEDDPEVIALRKRLDDTEKAAKETKDKADKEAAERKVENRRSAIRDALVDAGVPADRAKLAIPFLESEGLITTDDKGIHGFKAKDKYGADVILAGKAGAAGWLTTDEGKAYLPPKKIAGDGERAGDRQNSGGGGNAPRDEKGKLDWGALGGKALAGAANQMDVAE